MKHNYYSSWYTNYQICTPFCIIQLLHIIWVLSQQSSIIWIYKYTYVHVYSRHSSNVITGIPYARIHKCFIYPCLTGPMFNYSPSIHQAPSIHLVLFIIYFPHILFFITFNNQHPMLYLHNSPIIQIYLLYEMLSYIFLFQSLMLVPFFISPLLFLANKSF